MIKYDQFIKESQIYKLILEGQMVFSRKFIELINNIYIRTEDQIIKNLIMDIFENENRFVDISANYIDISDDPKMVWFTPDEKIKDDEILYRLKRTAPAGILSSNNDYNILKNLGIEEHIEYIDINILYEFDFKVLKKIKSDLYSSFLFFLIQLDNGNKALFYTNKEYQDPILRSKSLSNSKTKIRFGRFLNAFLQAIGRKYSSATIEKFVNLFQSEVELENNAMSFFKVVKGNEIKKWYLSSSYAANSGQLGNSCMRYSKCQSYFDIYINNPDVCNLLIYEKDGKLLGRALVWTLEDGRKYMDRIYTIKDNLDILFIRWADDNKVIYETNTTKTVRLKYTMEIKFIIDEELEFPYMDTFYFYKPQEGYLTNKEKNIDRPYLTLDNTDGSATIRYKIK
jgi:hypothetical protein